MESLFGRYEAAALLAVERANGGELAPLEQVLGAFENLFGSSVTASTFTESVGLLIDAGLADWDRGGLELSVEGRKAIRRAGAHWDAELPDKLADRLALLKEADLAPEGERPAPSEEEVRDAMASLHGGLLEATADAGGAEIPPSKMGDRAALSSRLLAGLPGAVNLRLGAPGREVPAADPPQIPAESDEED